MGKRKAVLHLTLKRKWFDLVLSGEKKEEYREVKPHWMTRFGYPHPIVKWDQVLFRNGYAKNAPEIMIELKDIKTGLGDQDWGADWLNDEYILKLGNIISTKNIKHCETASNNRKRRL
jgi:hypothetical protein